MRRAIDPSQKPPTLRGVDGVQAMKFSAEHGIVALVGPAEWPRVGDRVELEVNFTDQTVHCPPCGLCPFRGGPSIACTASSGPAGQGEYCSSGPMGADCDGSDPPCAGAGEVCRGGSCAVICTD